MKTIPFTAFFQRIQQATSITTQMELADALKVNRSAITQAKKRDAVPHKWILALARQFHISPDWLEFGKGATRTQTNYVSHPANNLTAGEQIRVPLVNATLCAGGGSFDTTGNVLGHQEFSYTFLSRMGAPSSMVLMPVMGDSMEPIIFDGDTVLVDQSQHQVHKNAIFAVGVEDTIYIKRISVTPNTITLHSDNELYSPIILHEEERETFRVLGKIVWLCRDCRFL